MVGDERHEVGVGQPTRRRDLHDHPGMIDRRLSLAAQMEVTSRIPLVH